VKPVCLITGAGGLLGQALCRSLVGDFHIVATYRQTSPSVRSQNAWPVLAAENQQSSNGAADGVYCVKADLTDTRDIQRLVEVAIARYDRIDVIVNSAADVAFHGKLSDLHEAGDYPLRQFAINCVAPLRLASAVFHACWKDRPDENAQWNRSVVNVSSMSGLYAFHDTRQAFYAASKSALNMLTLHLAADFAPYLIRVNALCPGRFLPPSSTDAVVSVVRRLITGTMTGIVHSDS
jgi:NAD(P)-dependent dehydrogenase (short-subunit alcohol dehydrogenase family)